MQNIGQIGSLVTEDTELTVAWCHQANYMAL